MPPKERIPKSIAWLMIGTALLLDIISIFPVAEWFTDLGNVLIFPFWFKIRGASFFTKKNYSMLWWELAITIIEAIPVVGEVLPSITVGVARNVLYIRKQDRLAIAQYYQAQTTNLSYPDQINQPNPSPNPKRIGSPSSAGKAGSGAGNVNRKTV